VSMATGECIDGAISGATSECRDASKCKGPSA
jgi:hypothetical protein